MLHNKQLQILETFVIGKRFSLPSLWAGRVGAWLRQQQPVFSAPSEMGPGTLCCSACSWTNVSFGNKIQRNSKGLKIAVCVHNWDKLRTTRNKQTNKNKKPKTNTTATQLPCLKNWEQKQGTARVPCIQH